MAAEQFANLAATTLNGAINNAVTTVVVASGAAPFPSSAQFRIVVDSEIMLVTAGAGTASWTVTRGAESTTAASHADGAAVTCVLTAGALGVVSDPAAAVPGLRTLGSGATQAAGGTDSRLSDTRTPTDGTVTDAKIVAAGLTNAAIASAAAIANTKLATNPLARANHTGTQTMSTISDAGTLATKSAIASADITDGTIVDADINGSAAIAASKISGTAVTQADTGTVTSAMILDGTILNADVKSNAALAVSKLATGNAGELVKTINGAVVSGRPPNYYKMPTGAVAETWPRHSPSQTTAITTGVVWMAAIELEAGMVVANFNYRVGGTGATGPTHQWALLTDSSRVMLAVSADGTSTAIGANSTITYAVANVSGGAAASYTVPTTGLYYCGLMIAVSTTMPNIVNAAIAGKASDIAPTLSGNSATTAQTTAPGFPTTIGAITGASPYVYMWIT